jgi:pantoate--beta-alanine ligase
VKLVTSVDDVSELTRSWREKGQKIVLVPTMGWFHEGHLSLMRMARNIGTRVIVSLFVNPIQFGPKEDLAAYPRDLERDRHLAEKEAVDVLFAPAVSDMFGQNFQTRVSLNLLSQGLCGSNRPGHFDGVATIVSKLFHITHPNCAVFGQKDLQQLAIIRRMVRDLNFDVEIVGHPIVRERDGLAMSSRNSYLTGDDRKNALCLYTAIIHCQQMVENFHGKISINELISEAGRIIDSFPGCIAEYIQVVDRQSLQECQELDQNSVLALAVKVGGKVRLIDNAVLMDQ